MSRDAAIQIIQRLREKDHVAYLAGGCVRDRLLGIEPKDHDVATDAPPEVVQKLFRRSQPVGEAFGVVLVYPGKAKKGAKNSGGIEVATFRTEGAYSDGRHPDKVKFSDAKHDAQRRDFTINGLFEDPLHPETPNPDADHNGVIDYVDGRADIQTKTLRAIGDPAQRFAEDYLRMLRAVRFSARLDFNLEPDTAEAIRTHASKLDQIARERIGDEVRQMLTGPRPYLAAQLLSDTHLNPVVFQQPLGEQGTDALGRLDASADYATRLHTLIGQRTPRVTRSQLREALMLSNEEQDHLRDHETLEAGLRDWPNATAAARKRLASHPRFEQAVLAADASDFGDAELTQILRDVITYRGDGIGLAPAPLLDGEDLIKLGLKPGPRFKPLLHDAYDAQLEGQIVNRDQALQWLQDQL